jgi:tetratricopeptide (TPR) repeat protein
MDNDPKNGMSQGLKRLYENVTTYQASEDETLTEIQQLKDMLEKNPANLDIKEWLAFKLYSVGDYQNAEGLFRDLILADHRAGVQNFYLGNLLAKTGREQEAVSCWKATIALIPKDVKAKKAQARIDKLKP